MILSGEAEQQPPSCDQASSPPSSHAFVNFRSSELAAVYANGE